MLQRVPIPIEHATRVEFLCESDKFSCRLRSFRERGRIGNLQMQRMQNVATIERTCDCHEALHFRAEVDRHAVAPAQIAIDLNERTRPPFLKAAAIAA
jgi:hypothetical protein